MLTFEKFINNAWQKIANSGNNGDKYFVYVNDEPRLLCLKDAPNRHRYSQRHNATLVGVYTAAVTPDQLADDVHYALANMPEVPNVSDWP